jgi:cysteine synthase A
MKKKIQDPFIFGSPLDLKLENIFFELDSFIQDSRLYLKLDGLNLAGSIKLKPAIEMIASLEDSRRLIPGVSQIIESSSGNLGVALSLVCAVKGYKFTCISDPNISKDNEKDIKLYGGEVIIVEKRDKNGGYLNTRIDLIKKMVKENQNIIWLNQYANEGFQEDSVS